MDIYQYRFCFVTGGAMWEVILFGAVCTITSAIAIDFLMEGLTNVYI